MADTKYKLRYLPQCYEDLEQKVVYNNSVVMSESLYLYKHSIGFRWGVYSSFNSVK